MLSTSGTLNMKEEEMYEKGRHLRDDARQNYTCLVLSCLVTKWQSTLAR